MTITTFNFPNGLDVFQPVLINDITVVNANHVQDLRISILEIENALVGITNLPYVDTSIVSSTDNIIQAIQKLDANLAAVLIEIGFLGDGYEGYASRIDAIQTQLIAHRESAGPLDLEGYGVHGVDGYVVGTNNIQALFNKTIDTGTDPSLVGPKIVIRATAGDPGERQLEVWNTAGLLSAWIDEAGNAYFAGDITVDGDEIVQDTQVVQSHLIVDGYTVLGNASQLWTTTINGNLLANNTSTTFNSASFTLNGLNAAMGSGSGSLNLLYSQAQISGNLTVNGALAVAGLTALGDGSGDPLNITGDTTIYGDLEVQQSTRLQGDVQLGNNVLVDQLLINALSITANVGSGEINFNANLNVTGNVQADGSYHRLGRALTTSSNTIELNGNTIIGGATQALDDINLSGSLVASQDISAVGDLSASGSVTVGSGGTTLQANMSNSSFTGNGTFGGSLSAAGSTIFGSSATHTHTITGNVSVAGEASITSLLVGGGYQGNTYNGLLTDHGGVTIYSNGDLALDGKLTVKGPIDPISLVIVADASQETVPLKIFASSSDFPSSPSFRVDMSGNSYSEGSLHYDEGGYFGPNGVFTKITASEFTVGTSIVRPAVTMRATTIQLDNSNLLEIIGNTKLGSNASNTHQIFGDTTLDGSLIISGSINGVSISGLDQDFQNHIQGNPYPAHDASQIRFVDNNTNIGERPLRDALEIVAGSGWDPAIHDSLIEHIVSTTAHQSQDITFASSSFPLVSNVKEAVHALAGSGWQLGVDDTLKQHLDSTNAHAATGIAYTPLSNSALTGNKVQSALQQASTLLDQSIIVDQQSVFRTNLAPRASSPINKTIIVSAAPRGVFVHAQTRTVLATDQIISFAAAPSAGYTIGTPYRRANVALRANGNLIVNYGSFASSVGALQDPTWEAGTLPIAVVNLFFNSPIAGDITNIGASAVVDVRPLPMGTTGGPIVGSSFDVPSAQVLNIGASVGNNSIFIGGATSIAILPGALEVQGITGGTLFQASIGLDTDTTGGTLGLGESTNVINLGRSQTVTYAQGDLTVTKIVTVEGSVKTNNIDVLSYGDSLYIGSSAGTGTVYIGDSATRTYLAGSATVAGNILFTGPITATIDVDTPKPMAIGASVGSNTLTLGSTSTQIVFLGSPRLKQSLKFEDPGVGTHTVTVTAPTNMPASTNLTLPTTSGVVALTNDVPIVFKDLLQEPTGFTNREDSELSFDPVTRIVTVQPKAPAVSFTYWIRGAEFIKTVPQTVEIPDEDGLYLVYFDGEVLVADLVPPDLNLFSGVAFAAVLQWNSAQGKAVIFGDERHGLIMDGKTHEYLHETEGTRYQDGLQIVNFTLGGSPTLDSSAQFGITGGRIKDEDLTHTIIHSALPSSPYHQDIAEIARLPILYRLGSGGSWYRDNATVYPLKVASGTIRYNHNPGTGWTTTAAPEASFVAMWILATNDMAEPIMAIVGQRSDATLADARQNNIWSSMDVGQFPTPESRLLYRVIYQTSSTYSNIPNAVLMDIADYRSVPMAGAGLSASSDHSALSGLEKDTHDQYVNKYGRPGGQTIYGGTTPSNILTLRSTSDSTKGQIVVDETTAATSTTTGALTIAGGLGVQGNIFAGGYIASQQVYGGSSAGSTLTLRSSLNATKGRVIVDEATPSTSPTTGAFTVAGGVGIQGNVAMGGAQYVNYSSTVTSNYAVSATDFIIPVNTSTASSNIVVTLPSITSATRGRLIVVKDIGGATSQLNKAIVIQASGGNTIDGAASVTIDTEYFALTLVSNGATNWSII